MAGGFGVLEFVGGADGDVVCSAEGGGGDLVAAAAWDDGEGSGGAGFDGFDGDLGDFGVEVEQHLGRAAEQAIEIGV